MKQPEVDYRSFHLRKRNDPRFSHLKLLLGWVVYLVLYLLTERLIPAEDCTSIHIPLDDWIPFCEWFLIPYVLWYPMIVFSLGYFLLYRIDAFRRLQTAFILIQVTASLIYILYPSRQDLRPVIFPRDNLLTQGVALLYRVDTNTGVCPSLHVALSIAMASAWLKERQVPRLWKGALVALAMLICLSTMFIKQHSAGDFLAALPVCLMAEVLVYGKAYWLPKFSAYSSHTC